jgi:hypothetical protein
MNTTSNANPNNYQTPNFKRDLQSHHHYLLTETYTPRYNHLKNSASLTKKNNAAEELRASLMKQGEVSSS